MKPLRILAQVRAIQAIIDRDGNCTERHLSLEVLNLRQASETAASMSHNGGYATAAPYEGMLGAMGGRMNNIPIAMLAEESKSIKAGDWLAIRVTQLSEEEQDTLAKSLVERTTMFEEAEKLSRAGNEESRAIALKQTALMEKMVNLAGPQFDG